MMKRALRSGNRQTSRRSGDRPDGVEFDSIGSGSTHQGHRRFRGEGLQCVAMSACACSFSVVNDRRSFSNSNIDDILKYGDSLYMSIISPGPSRLIFPEELPADIPVGNHLAKIKPIDDSSWKLNGLFAADQSSRDAKIIELEDLLRHQIFDDDHIDRCDNYLFTGQSNTISFWRHDNLYFVFNSHGVDENNRLAVNGKARLLRCNNLKSLAFVLFSGRRDDGSQFSIHKLRVELEALQSPTRVNIQSTLAEAIVTTDTKLGLQPIVKLERLNIDVSNKSSRKLGRPVKKKRGVRVRSVSPKNDVKVAVNNDSFSNDRKLGMLPVVVIEKNKIVEDRICRLENKNLSVRKPREHNPAVNREAVKRYTTRKPDVHRDAVKRYTTQHPDVNRDAVKKYNTRNPNVNRTAVKQYTDRNPTVHRTAVQRYTAKNPSIHRDAVQKYAEENPSVNKEAVKRYNTSSRNVEPALRSSSHLIGQKCNEQLDVVQIYSLKTRSLFTNEVIVCAHCHARLFFEEKMRLKWCCGAGAYNVQNFPPLDEDFYHHPAFLQRPRAYNNLFAFSALGVSHGFHNPPTGISFLKIQGRVYHRVFDLSYTDTTNPLNLYIHDSSERESLAAGLNLDSTVIRSINHFLHDVNPYIDCFKQLSREPSDDAHLIFERASRRTHGNILGDLPIGNEVAAILSTESERFIPNCIAVWKVGGRKPHTVDIMDQLYESFQFPLLYPHGNPGWFPSKLDNKGNKLTQNKYVRCLLLSEPRFSELGRLSEEWTVDMFSRISEERLRYISRLQSRSSNSAVRTAPLQEIEDNVDVSRQINEDETILGEEGGVVPGRVYLPNTFTGGPRFMKSKYMDSIALVNRLGPPSYFLTITCNPKWPEIQQSTPVGHRPHPLICARVFNLKLSQLFKDLRSGKWFGRCMYIMHVTEFQKRGLPHAHICFRVEGGGPVQNVDIDQFVRADLPASSEAEGRLRKAVLDHMIHGPCGPPFRTDLPCWDQDKKRCVKFFPQRETSTTYCDDRGFVHLKRSSKNEATIRYRGRDVPINDLWVVSYNAALLLKYDCHINLCAYSARAVVRYLFKYMTKGPDHSRVMIVSEADRYNEIEQYVTKRYLGSCEATWRILEFDVCAREPNVKQLSVHLEGQQSVFFKPGTEAGAAQRASSDLLTYFCRPPGEEFDSLTYLDFYEKFIVHSRRPAIKSAQIYTLSNGRFITRRQRGELVTRLFWVGPNRGEQFYLRLLLASFPCRSYGDLYALGGPNCTTFQDAAKAVGVANDELEYELAMEEACTFLSAGRLRSFLVLLAVNGIRVASLWEKYKSHMSVDIRQLLPDPDDEQKSYEYALIKIDRLLRKHGTSAVEQGLPAICDDTTELGRERLEYNQNELSDFVDEWLPQLSEEQKVIFDYIDRLLKDRDFRESSDTALFIDGPAGTGKTLLLKLITAHVRANLKGIALCTASSGIAAQNYVGGTTAHSMFKFPLDPVDDLGYWNITNGSQRAELIYHADVIIYDEAPMAHKYLIHLLDRSLRDLMKSEFIFGGKIVIFAGDFRQIPPVVINAKTPSDVINCSVKSSALWQKLKSFSLTTSQRCREDREYSDFLLNLGSNLLETHAVPSGKTIQNLVDLSMLSFVTELDELTDFVFPDVILEEPDACAHRAILSTHNENVREINGLILDRLPAEALHFYSIDEVVTENVDEIYLGADALNRLQPKGVPPHDLTLKIGCVCIIIRNLSFADGLVNGTKVIVVNTSPRLITVRRPGEHLEFLIPRILFKSPIEPNSPIEMTRRQFPIQICYAMTIHKSQGQTISRVGVDLRSDVFSHGQLYVALGRVTESRNIKILVHKTKIINNKPLVNNVVYPQLL